MYFGGKNEVKSMERLWLCFGSLKLKNVAVSEGSLQQGVPSWKASVQDAIFNPRSFSYEV